MSERRRQWPSLRLRKRTGRIWQRSYIGVPDAAERFPRRNIYLAGMESFGKPYCRHCLDERQLEAKNFELVVNDAKRRRTEDGTSVQSVGEKRIADWLSERRIAYVYDERYRMAGDIQIRPDFYLPEFDLYIEYWGMDTPEYVANMKKKLFLYQRCGKKLISISFRDFDNIEDVLAEKLSRYIRL